MARVNQRQCIDRLINAINTVAENRYSLSEKDLETLNEASSLLLSLNEKKGKTNKQILDVIVRVFELLSNFLISDSKVLEDSSH